MKLRKIFLGITTVGHFFIIKWREKGTSTRMLFVMLNNVKHFTTCRTISEIFPSPFLIFSSSIQRFKLFTHSWKIPTRRSMGKWGKFLISQIPSSAFCVLFSHNLYEECWKILPQTHIIEKEKRREENRRILIEQYWVWGYKINYEFHLRLMAF